MLDTYEHTPFTDWIISLRLGESGIESADNEFVLVLFHFIPFHTSRTWFCTHHVTTPINTMCVCVCVCVCVCKRERACERDRVAVRVRVSVGVRVKVRLRVRPLGLRDRGRVTVRVERTTYQYNVCMCV